MFRKILIWIFGESKKPKHNAMIVVERTRKRVFARVRKGLIPKDSFEKEYNGGWLHILGLDLNNKLWTILPPAAVEGRLPTDLYMAKNCAEEVLEVYGLSENWKKAISLGVLVGLTIAELIIIFLMVTTTRGK